MKVLYSGFDLCSPTTSVSMTINGPAPTILAMFMNTAIDQQLDKFARTTAASPTDDEAAKIRAWTLANVRGTVQADILKEDQGQNTCIFSTEFTLKVMGDIQEYFVAPQRAELLLGVDLAAITSPKPGANPISQLAFTLANGFTFVESLPRARHAHRRLRAQPVVLLLQRHGPRVHGDRPRGAADLGGGDEGALRRQRAQPEAQVPLQTSGRSLHAQEIEFNDIRTTLQALIAIYDNCNSLHTNAYDEAITTPTEESVRRAMAIQLIINREWGLAKNENPHQGAFIIDELTDLVEEAVLTEFERIAERGGVLGAMETGYQRGRIQDESMLYEHAKHDGSLPIIGVNTFRNPHGRRRADRARAGRARPRRKSKASSSGSPTSTPAHAAEPPAALQRLQDVVIDDGNVFDELMDAVRVVLARPDHQCTVRGRRPVPAQHVADSHDTAASQELLPRSN